MYKVVHGGGENLLALGTGREATGFNCRKGELTEMVFSSPMSYDDQGRKHQWRKQPAPGAFLQPFGVQPFLQPFRAD